jgi:mannose-6-phosphate isomerase-like protein (cupin superfamily)
MTSDHHSHVCIEQVYYILSGSGEVLNEDERHVTHPGDAVYLPSGEHHQMFNEEDPWLEHHVISASVENDGGTFAIRNWKDVAPTGDGVGAVRWHQLGREGEENVGHLRSFHFIDREAVQPGAKSVERSYEEIEQVYYILENKGTILIDGKEQAVTEGDNVHISPGEKYEVRNPHEEWLTYLIIGA